MKITLILLALVLSLNYTCAAQQTLPADSLHPFGRSWLTGDKHLELIGSAVHFGFSFSGSECSLYAYIPDGGNHGYLQYELDGVYQKRIKVEGGSYQPLVIQASSDGRHTVWVYKATEALTGPIFVEKITGKDLHAVTTPQRPLIEFIGNSITCGAAADPSEFPCGTGQYQDHHNAYYAYGPRVARALKTNFILSSVSGIGVYRNWNTDGPAMPQVYETADLQLNSHRMWDFSRYRPAIVSIALGGNDYSKGDGVHPRLPFDSAAFVSHYIKFVRLVKSKYPAAQIALLSCPTMGGSQRTQLHNCLAAIKKSIDTQYPSDKPIALFLFQTMKSRGCDGHPNVEDHGIIAEELVPFFQKLLH